MSGIYYRSSVRPWNDFSSDQPIALYFGLLQRLTRQRLDHDGPKAIQDSVQDMKELIRPRRLGDGTFVEPAGSSMAIERYDAYALDDADNDLLVFWRIPFKPVHP